MHLPLSKSVRSSSSEMSKKNLSLQSVHLREAAILKQRDHLAAILDTNSPGAASYLKVYGAFHELVDGSMKRKVDEFIQQSGELKVSYEDKLPRLGTNI